MDFSELDAFVKVVQTGSFTRAAEQMGKQKAHLSRVVAQLEAKLGVRLLERSTRALSLTEVGREIFERALGILGAVDDVQHVAQKTQDEPRGVLKLTCGVEFGMLAVNRWMAGYMQRYPSVTVHADMTARLVDLVHEGFDVAIRLGTLSDSSLAARKLGDLHYGLFASPDYLEQCGTPKTPAQLQEHDRLAFVGGVQTHSWRLHSKGQEVKIDSKARMRVNNSFTVRDAAVAGLGIAQLPWLMAEPYLHSGQLLQVLPRWTTPTVPVHAVFPSARYLTPKVRAFIDYAVQVF